MKVPELLDEVRRQVPEGAPVGTRCKLTSVIQTPGGAHDIAVAARTDGEGRRREQFWCDEVRVELPVLLRLTCPEGECPHVVQVRAQWDAFRRKRKLAAKPGAPMPQPLMAETRFSAGGQSFDARPARFPCYTSCPNAAHPPLTIEKTGFDLFDDSGCVGGGVRESRGVRRPRLPTVRDAQAYVLARQLEALVTVGRARETSRSRPDPTTEAD